MDFNGIIEKIEKDSFDLLFDCVGASNYELSRQLLGMDSHWVMFGFLGGSIIN
jgi:NADPH:quinone reductase-like Zn-dependent oxidoreductase